MNKTLEGMARAKANSGAPAVLAAFGKNNVEALKSIKGALVTGWTLPPPPEVK